MRRRLFTPRQRRADRRRQLLRDLVLGAIVVAIAQMAAPHLPLVQQIEALPLVATAPTTPASTFKPPMSPTLGGTSATATAGVAPLRAPIPDAAPYPAGRPDRDR